jgi:hypothetical protein
MEITKKKPGGGGGGGGEENTAKKASFHMKHDVELGNCGIKIESMI